MPNPASTNSISGGYIYSLFKDNNMLWVGCDQFLDRFDPTTETFAHFRVKSDDSGSAPVTVLRLAQDQLGTPLLGTPSGMYALDSTTGRIIHHYTHDPRDPSTLSSNEINSIVVDQSGRLLVADGDHLEQLDQTTGKVVWRFSLPGLSIIFNRKPTSVGAARANLPGILLWADYNTNWEDGGLGHLDPNGTGFTFYSFYDAKSGKPLYLSVSAMVEESSGSFLLGGNGGLVRFEPEARRAIRYHHHIDDPESLDDDRVMALREDSEGNIWVGFHAREPDVFSTRKPSFLPILRESLARNPLGEHMVSAIYGDSGTLWLGASGNLIRVDCTLALVLYARLAAQQNIRHVDFKNFNYPLSGHLLGHGSLEWLDTPAHPAANTRTIHLVDGSDLTKTSRACY